MSYNGRSFKKHTGAQGSQAARMANALVKGGTPAHEAVKTADKAAAKAKVVHDPFREGYNKV
jgi:hypothetical protein